MLSIINVHRTQLFRRLFEEYGYNTTKKVYHNQTRQVQEDLSINFISTVICQVDALDGEFQILGWFSAIQALDNSGSSTY
ncbi:hypothetical protein TMatcc_010830 [Talaromyces marneffei ATCC 18224]